MFKVGDKVRIKKWDNSWTHDETILLEEHHYKELYGEELTVNFIIDKPDEKAIEFEEDGYWYNPDHFVKVD